MGRGVTHHQEATGNFCFQEIPIYSLFSYKVVHSLTQPVLIEHLGLDAVAGIWALMLWAYW